MKLQAGDKVEFIIGEGGQVLLTPVKTSVKEVYGILHRPWQPVVSIEEMDAAIRWQESCSNRVFRTARLEKMQGDFDKTIGMKEEKRKIMFLKNLAQELSLDIIYAFGSRAKEVAEALSGQSCALSHSPSDVDIGVKPLPGRSLTISDKVEIAQRIEDVLDVPRVDLVCLPEADPFLAANIIRGERIYAGDDDRADEYELYILRRAGDCLHLERERLALIMGEE